MLLYLWFDAIAMVKWDFRTILLKVNWNVWLLKKTKKQSDNFDSFDSLIWISVGNTVIWKNA